MATQQQFNDLVARLNAATSAAGAKITELRDKLASALNNAGLTGTEEQAALDQLGSVASALEAMAQDPANPVPVEPPPVDTGGGTGEV